MSAPPTTGRPSRLTVLRDVATFILGWVLIFIQVLGPAEKVNVWFILFSATLVGTPATLNALSKIRGGGTTEAPTSSASSPSSSSSPGRGSDE